MAGNGGEQSDRDSSKALAFEDLVEDEPLVEHRRPTRKSGKAPSGDPTALVAALERKIDRLAERMATTPAGTAEARDEAEALRSELRDAFRSLATEVRTDLNRVTQQLAQETGDLRTEVKATLALVATQSTGGTEDKGALASSSERIQSFLTEDRRAMQGAIESALARESERMHSTLDAERRAFRSELQAVVSRLAEQAAEDRKERRTELHNLIASSTERLRSVLVDERKELRGELQIVLPDVLRHRAEEWQQLRSALEASLVQSGEGTLRALTQLGQQLVEVRREVVATIAKANDRRVEEREQLLGELQAALANTHEQLADDQRRLRAALDAALAQARSERAAFEASVGQSGERTGEVLAELSQRLVELRRELSGVSGQLSTQQAEEGVRVRADFRTGLVNSHNQLVAQQHELHRALETKLAKEREARTRDTRQQAAEMRAALEEIKEALSEDRRELRLLMAATVEAANQWFNQLRDQLYERLETVIDVTAQSSASAASAVKALRRDLKQVEADPRLLEALAQLGDEIERLEQKIPARVALRLPDSQLAAIVEAVKAAPTPARATAGTRKAPPKKATKKPAPRAVRQVAPPGAPRAPARETDVRAW